jgi:glycosyltransferase involved in cell wall biosynthesis
MKVIHLTSGKISDGAAKGALRLHEGLLDIGVSSYIVSHNTQGQKVENHIGITSLLSKIKYAINYRLNRILSLTLKDKSTMFSFGLEPFDAFNIPNLQDFDIVHLHWVNYSLSIATVKKLAANHKIVWTIRDMWIFTGGCHYSLSCNSYKSGCDNCPLMKTSFKFLPSYLYKKKIDSFKKVNFVAISEWCKGEAISSRIVQGADKIYNSYSPKTFFAKEKSKTNVKLKLDISSKRKIILLGAQDLTSAYKGGKFILDFIRMHKDTCHFVMFGNGSEKIIKQVEGVSYTSFGFVDEETLNDLYNVSDVFLMLSIQEGFGKTVIESLATGTPVIVLKDSGGPHELMSGLPSECGWIWDGVSYIDLQKRRHVDPANVEAKFSNRVIANDYLAAYEKHLDNSQSKLLLKD